MLEKIKYVLWILTNLIILTSLATAQYPTEGVYYTCWSGYAKDEYQSYIDGSEVNVTGWTHATSTDKTYYYFSNTGTTNNGEWKICLYLPSDLEYNETYYIDVALDGNDLDFNTDERQAWLSLHGEIPLSSVSGLSSGNITAEHFHSTDDMYVADDLTVNDKLIMNGNINLNGNYLSGDGDNEGMEITPTGLIGLGVSPSYKLHVSDSGTGGWTTVIDGASTRNGLWSDIESTSGSNYAFLATSNNSLNILFSVRADGNVGVGTNTPATEFEVVGDSQTEVTIKGGEANAAMINLYADEADDNNDLLRVYKSDSGNFAIEHFDGDWAQGLIVQPDGDTRIGTGTVGCLMDYDFTILSGSCTSDERLKKDITPLPNVLNKIKQINVKRFRYLNETANSTKHVGLIAQELQAVAPGLVQEDEQGYLRISYTSEMMMYIIKGIQELAAENDLLKTEGQALKSAFCEEFPSKPVCQ